MHAIIARNCPMKSTRCIVDEKAPCFVLVVAYDLKQTERGCVSDVGSFLLLHLVLAVLVTQCSHSSQIVYVCISESYNIDLPPHLQPPHYVCV
jgi:hypothetical protein